MTTTPTNLLRAAADLLRAAANAAAEHSGSTTWQSIRHFPDQPDSDFTTLTAGPGRPLHKGGGRGTAPYMHAPVSEYAALMGPGVGLALAQLLDGVMSTSREADHEECQRGCSPEICDLSAALAVARQLLGTTETKGAPDVVAALGDGGVRCPLCPGQLMLHTPSGARAHFTHVHPEQQISGRQGPWPVLIHTAPPAPADRAAVPATVYAAIRRLAAHAVGFQDVLDEGDQGAWGKTIGADIAELRRLADGAAAGVQPPTTTDRAAALGMTPTEYRQHSHTTAVQQIQAAAQGLFAGTAIRVADALEEPTTPPAAPAVPEEPTR